MGYNPDKELQCTSNTYVRRVEKNFKNLLKSLEWRSFYVNGLLLVIDFCKDVQEALMQNGLNGAQTRALAKLKAASNVEFQRLTVRDKTPPKSEMGYVSKDSCQSSLREMSAREIDNIADRAVKKETLKELNRPRVSTPSDQETVILLMN